MTDMTLIFKQIIEPYTRNDQIQIFTFKHTIYL